ncbi:MAG: hypothetical protein ABJP82_20370 [Hyphomicrobiales bacterium]
MRKVTTQAMRVRRYYETHDGFGFFKALSAGSSALWPVEDEFAALTYP